jgi:hypothetical protein
MRRADPLYRAALQFLRQRSRRQLEVAAVAAVAVIGLIAGVVAGLTGSSSSGSGTGTGTAQLTAAHATNTATTAANAQPYSMYDSVTPAQIPSGQPVATYADGSYAVSPSQVSGKQVIWIDTNGSAPARASVLDVEPGDATPQGAAAWAQARLTADPHAPVRIYTMLSEWGAAKAAIATLPGWMQSHVKWWIADPTGVQHVVPGSTATQWYWGSSYDISTVNPGF